MRGKLYGTVMGFIANVHQGKQGICVVRQKANNITERDIVQSYPVRSSTVLRYAMTGALTHPHTQKPEEN